MSFGTDTSGYAVFSRQGCVAEQSTTVVPQTSDRKFTARLKSVSIFAGTVCTSSRMMMLLERA